MRKASAAPERWPRRSCWLRGRGSCFTRRSNFPRPAASAPAAFAPGAMTIATFSPPCCGAMRASSAYPPAEASNKEALAAGAPVSQPVAAGKRWPCALRARPKPTTRRLRQPGRMGAGWDGSLARKLGTRKTARKNRFRVAGGEEGRANVMPKSASAAARGAPPPLARIEAIAGRIEQNGAANEALGQLTPEGVDKPHEARLFRLLPREYDGEEVDLVTWFRAMEALARLDASTAWR